MEEYCKKEFYKYEHICKLVLGLIEHYTMKTYGGVVV
jgi:hypothetical protein